MRCVSSCQIYRLLLVKTFLYYSFVLLLCTLGSCTLFRPYRIPTPKPSPEFKAQQAAAKKAKKAQQQEEKATGMTLFKRKPKGDKKNPDEFEEDAATDVAAPLGPSGAPSPTATATTATTPEARTLPERSTVRYNKQLIMKKPKLIRRRVNKPTWSFHPWQSVRDFFKYGLRRKPNYSPDHRPVVPSPTPDAAPDAATEPQPDAKPDAKPAATPEIKP